MRVSSRMRLTCASISGSVIPNIWVTRIPAFVALSMATVATGIPFGICTVEYKASKPDIALPDKGTTPTTGNVVCADTTPARCADPQIIAEYPFDANSTTSRGRRFAEHLASSCVITFS